MLKQINTIKEIIQNNDSHEFIRKFAEIKEETVKKAILNEAIKHGDFNTSLIALYSIQNKELLGPQLTIAAKLTNNDIAQELLLFIKNPYYLAKTAEIAACQDNQDLANKAIAATNNSWFTARATQYLNEAKEASDEFNICLNFEFAASINGICEIKLFDYYE